MVRTGQGRHWDDPERYLGHGVGSPGITVDAAQWLADREVFLVGADTSIVEQVVGVLTGLPVHLLLLSQRGVHLLENMELEAMHETRAVEFLFVCLPLLLKGASGSPVRPVALI
jgi:kynurenine formamidase